MNPEPWIFLETEMGASCSAVEAVRDQVEKHVDCSTGYRCNEGIMDVWEHTPVPPGTKPS
jgi:N-acetyl-gamma-glutamylphosphate reductase